MHILYLLPLKEVEISNQANDRSTLFLDCRQSLGYVLIYLNLGDKRANDVST
jgi:hypothetical protein